jgi:hypothetical protein
MEDKIDLNHNNTFIFNEENKKLQKINEDHIVKKSIYYLINNMINVQSDIKVNRSYTSINDIKGVILEKGPNRKIEIRKDLLKLYQQTDDVDIQLDLYAIIIDQMIEKQNLEKMEMIEFIERDLNMKNLIAARDSYYNTRIYLNQKIQDVKSIIDIIEHNIDNKYQSLNSCIELLKSSIDSNDKTKTNSIIRITCDTYVSFSNILDDTREYSKYLLESINDMIDIEEFIDNITKGHKLFGIDVKTLNNIENHKINRQYIVLNENEINIYPDYLILLISKYCKQNPLIEIKKYKEIEIEYSMVTLGDINIIKIDLKLKFEKSVNINIIEDIFNIKKMNHAIGFTFIQLIMRQKNIDIPEIKQINDTTIGLTYLLPI